MKNRIHKIHKGLPFLRKEIESWISSNTPLFVSTPKVYYVIVGYRCNARCIMCTQDHSEKKPELTLDVMSKILRESKGLSKKGFHISITGGESLLYKHIFETLKLANEIDVNVGFTTNGYLLTRENVERIVSYDPFSIGVSIESVDPAINETLRPYKNGTKQTLDGVERLLEEKARKQSRIGIVIKPTITGLNYATIPDMVRYFGKKKGIIVNPQPYCKFEGMDMGVHERMLIKDLDGLAKMVEEMIRLREEGYAVNLSDEMLRSLVGYFYDMNNGGDGTDKQRYRCLIGTTTMFIGRDGTITICPFFEPTGNIYNDSLLEGWRGSKAQNVRNDIEKCSTNCMLTCTRTTQFFTKLKSYMRLG